MMLDQLPLDLWLDIFLRLPLKNMVLCGCTCKTLLSFLTGRPFMFAHLKKSFKTPRIFFRYYVQSKSRQYFSLQSDDESFTIGNNEVIMPIDCFYGRCFNVVGTFNGVICLSDDLYGGFKSTVLWNPCIRKYVQLPTPKFTSETHGSIEVCVGFGFDVITFDYKVVRLAFVGNKLYPHGRAPPRVEVYSLKTGLWKTLSECNTISCDIRNPSVCPSYTQVFIRGSCHWIGWREGNWKNVVKFDLEQEIFTEIKLPSCLEGGNCLKTDLKVTDYLSYLALVKIESESFTDDISPKKCNIWVMKEYGVVDSWICIFKCCSPSGDAQPQRFWFRKYQRDMLMLVNNVDDETYGLRSTKTKRCLGQVQGQLYGFYLGWYLESLALLKEGKAVPAIDDSVAESEDGDSSCSSMHCETEENEKDTSAAYDGDKMEE